MSHYNDEFEYIRNYYRVPAEKWGVVKVKGKFGVIIGVSGPHLKIRVEGGSPEIHHPTFQIEYMPDDKGAACEARN